MGVFADIGYGIISKRRSQDMKDLDRKKQFGYKPYKDGIEITKCILPEENIVIPKEIDGKKVKAIGSKAFVYSYEYFTDEESWQKPFEIKKIHIPETVEHISADAFCDGQNCVEHIFCNEITEFSVSPQNKYYCCENGTLYNKNKTELIQYPMGKRDTHFVIPDGVTNISENAFMFARFYEISMPESVVVLGKSAFQFCFKLKSIELKNVKVIPAYCFYECHNLKHVALGNKLKIIGNYAFYCCDLDSVELPENMERIGRHAFGLSRAKSIVIAKGLKEIPTGAFSYCRIERITIPKGVKKIGKYAFSDCSNLKEAVLPDGLSHIMKGAFMGCKPFDNLFIPKSVKKIDSYAFADTYLKDATVYDETETDELAFCAGSNDSIDAKEIYISKDVKYISPYAFPPHYYNIEKFTVDPENKYYFSWNGAIFSRVFAKNLVELVKYPINKSDTHFNLPENTYSVCQNAFYGNRNIENIVIGEGKFEYIAEGAFRECKNLRSIELPKSLKGIGNLAFAYCGRLKSIVLNDNISTIPFGCFYQCGRLEHVAFGKNITNVEAYSFGFCNKLKNIELPNSVKYIDCSAFLHCKPKGNITIPKNTELTNKRNLYKSCADELIMPKGQKTENADMLLQAVKQ